MNKFVKFLAIAGLAFVASASAFGQTYPKGLIDKSIAIVGNEMISISGLEQEIQVQRMNSPLYSDKNLRCEVLERMLEVKLFLMQARVDSLKVNDEMVTSNLNMRIDQLRSQLGGDEEVEKYFNKPLYKLRQEWRKSLEEQSLSNRSRARLQETFRSLPPAT